MSLSDLSENVLLLWVYLWDIAQHVILFGKIVIQTPSSSFTNNDTMWFLCIFCVFKYLHESGEKNKV